MQSLRQKITGLFANIHFSSLVSNLTFSATAFLSFILLSRNLPPSLFGVWVLFLTVASLVDMVVSGLTRSAVVYYGCRDDESRHTYNAASLVVMAAVVGIISVLFLLTVWIGGERIHSDWRMILLAYPLIGASGLFRMSALSFLQAQGQYHKTIFFRLIQSVGFLALVILLLWMEGDDTSFTELLTAYFLTSAASSLYVFFKGWSSAEYVRRVRRPELMQVLHYGKFTLFTNLGSSLLKSSDAFIIGLSPFGAAGVAVYAIPFKLVELIEIPLRSLAMSFFNEVSFLSMKRGFSRIRRLFVRYALLLSLLFIPILGFFVLFPRFLLELLGKGQYVDYYPVMESMLYVIAVYSFLMIPDRLIGVMLEGTGRPAANTVKTLVMALCNIVGDVVALFCFGSLVGVAYATMFFTLVGNGIGFLLLKRARLLPAVRTIGREMTYLRENGLRWVRK